VFDNEPIFGINAAFSAANVDINDPNQFVGTFQDAFAGDSSYYSARHYNDKQNSVFGEATFHASDSLRFIAGLRYLHATQHFTREGDRYYAGGPSTALIDSSANATTPRVAVDWDVDKDNTLYANIAKGFRLGAANRPVPLTALVQQDLADLKLPPEIPAAFKPDSLWSYEAGTKSRFMDGKLVLSAAVFYLDWKDIQQDVTLPSSGFDFETNVGRAKSYGIEFETRLRATEALTLTASGGLTRATFSEDNIALGESQGLPNARKGDLIQGVPKYNAALGFEYRFAAFGSGGAFVRGNGQWVGASRGDLNRDSVDYERPGYFTADASGGVTLDRWEFSAFVKNLLNNDKVIQRPNIQGVDTVYHLRPRTIGLTARYDF
jgi:outer membrane receptor protein involved in Fe transport